MEYAEFKTRLKTFLINKASKVFEAPAVTVEQSQKAKDLEQVIREEKAALGCASSAVARLLSVLVDEPVKAVADKGKHIGLRKRLFCPVVPVENNVAHNYEIGQVAVFVRTDSQRALKADGTLGNDLSTNMSSLRKPQGEEIERYVESLPEESARHYFGFLELI